MTQGRFDPAHPGGFMKCRCEECWNKRARKIRKRLDSPKYKEYMKKWTEENKKKLAERKREYRLKNPLYVEDQKILCRAQYEKNRIAQGKSRRPYRTADEKKKNRAESHKRALEKNKEYHYAIKRRTTGSYDLNRDISIAGRFSIDETKVLLREDISVLEMATLLHRPYMSAVHKRKNLRKAGVLT